jgi:hypothetical protein
MATTTIEIENDLIPEGYEAVRVGLPMKGEWFVGSTGAAVECLLDKWRADPRLIIRPLPKTTRPYNADEMRELVGTLLIHESGSRHIVSGCTSDGSEVCVSFASFSSETLREYYTHLDGRKCEVVE